MPDADDPGRCSVTPDTAGPLPQRQSKAWSSPAECRLLFHPADARRWGVQTPARRRGCRTNPRRVRERRCRASLEIGRLFRRATCIRLASHRRGPCGGGISERTVTPAHTLCATASTSSGSRDSDFPAVAAREQHDFEWIRCTRHAASSRQHAFKGSEIPIDPGILLDEKGAQSGPDLETTTASSGQLDATRSRTNQPPSS
jgi:hypothetical protein